MNSILASTRSGILLARLVNNGVSLNHEQRKAFYDQFYSIGDEFFMVDFPALPRLVVLLVYFCIKIGIGCSFSHLICCSRFWCH